MEFWQIVLVVGCLLSMVFALDKIADKLGELVKLLKREKPSYWRDEK